MLQIGCGVVGSAYLQAFHEKEFDIIGCDVSAKQVGVNAKKGLPCFRVDTVNQMYQDHFDYILISVPTPLDKKTNALDMRYIWSTLETCARVIKDDGVIFIRSTVPPGTTKKYANKLNELMTGEKKCHVLFNPEYLRARSALDDARNPWLITVGLSDDTLVPRIRKLFSHFTSSELVILNTEEAELQKLIHNYANAQKISFGNTVSAMVRNIGYEGKIDVPKVLITTTRTAECYLNPEYGFKVVDSPFNGTCLTKDPHQLASLARKGTAAYSFLQSTVDVNASLRGTKYDNNVTTGYAWNPASTFQYHANDSGNVTHDAAC